METDSFKWAETEKKKKEMRTSEERENFSKLRSVAEISSKKFTPGFSPCNTLRTILKIDKGGTQTNGPTNKKVNDYTESLPPNMLYN